MISKETVRGRERGRDKYGVYEGYIEGKEIRTGGGESAMLCEFEGEEVERFTESRKNCSEIGRKQFPMYDG